MPTISSLSKVRSPEAWRISLRGPPLTDRRCGTSPSRLCHDYARGQSSAAATKKLAAHHGLCSRQWRNGASVPWCDPAMSTLDRGLGRGGGRGGRPPQAHVVTAGSVLLYPSGHDPAPDAVLAAPAPATTRNPPAPEVSGGEPGKQLFKNTRSAFFISTALSPHRGRQAAPVGGDQENLKARFRPVVRACRPFHRLRHPGKP